MKALFTLTTAESKRLIAKSVIKLPEVEKALQNHRVIIAGGVTNGYIAEELLGKEIDKTRYTAGIVTEGVQCVTPVDERIAPVVLDRGIVSEKSWIQAVEEFDRNDVFLKGANAIDSDGIAGVMAADPFGGTIGKALGIVLSRGSKLIMPVGLEKMIPSVKSGTEIAGQKEFDLVLGQSVGLIPVLGAKVFTEIDALNNLFNVQAVCVAAGGIGGSEGAVTLAIEGADENVKQAFEFIKKIKGEKSLQPLKQKCKCNKPCDRF